MLYIKKRLITLDEKSFEEITSLKYQGSVILATDQGGNTRHQPSPKTIVAMIRDLNNHENIWIYQTIIRTILFGRDSPLELTIYNDSMRSVLDVFFAYADYSKCMRTSSNLQEFRYFLRTVCTMSTFPAFEEFILDKGSELKVSPSTGHMLGGLAQVICQSDVAHRIR